MNGRNPPDVVTNSQVMQVLSEILKHTSTPPTVKEVNFDTAIQAVFDASTTIALLGGQVPEEDRNRRAGQLLRAIEFLQQQTRIILGEVK